MKAIVYHADKPLITQRYKKGIYKDLFKGLKKNLNDFNIPLIHLTLNGFEGWGDENYHFDGNPEEVNYNRELLIVEFLKNIADDKEIYWITEPDARLNNMFPPLEGDASFTVLLGEKRITPQWRLVKKSSLPIFEEIVSMYGDDKEWWGGDSEVWGRMWYQMGQPSDDCVIDYKNLKIQLRKYKHYNMIGSHYSQQFKSNKKRLIASQEFLNEDQS